MSAAEPVDITVTFKGDEQRYSQKFLTYDAVTCHYEDPVIKNCIEEAKKSYKGIVEDIQIKCSFQG